MNITCVEPRTIHSMLHGLYLRIPRFQRPYLWERDDVDEFWSDAVKDNTGEHFIGSIVVFKIDDYTCGITDGQQRLTTIILLLCALRDELALRGEKALAQGVHALVERPNINNKLDYVLKSLTSSPYLLHRMCWPPSGPQPQPRKPEETNLAAAADYLRDKIAEYVAPHVSGGAGRRRRPAIDKLLEIRDKIAKLRVIYVELDNDDDAYTVFETINSRGKDLRPSDLVKSRIMQLLRPANLSLDSPREQWEEMSHLIESIGAHPAMDSFLLHYWLSKYEYTSAKKLFRAFKRIITKANAAELLSDLSREATIYRTIFEPDTRDWKFEEEPFARSLRALALFNVRQAIPMVMAVLRRYPAPLNLRGAIAAMRAIEAFHFQFTAITSSRSSGGIASMYAKLARQLDKSGSSEGSRREVDELRSKLRERLPTAAEFAATFRQKLYHRRSNKDDKALVRYILEEFDRRFRVSGTPADYSRMTVEHISPENPRTDAWKRLAPDDVGQVGNLLLVSEPLNGELDDKPFAEKKAILKNSDVWVGDDVYSKSTWGEKEIAARTASLAKLAQEKVWRF